MRTLITTFVSEDLSEFTLSSTFRIYFCYMSGYLTHLDLRCYLISSCLTHQGFFTWYPVYLDRPTRCLISLTHLSFLCTNVRSLDPSGLLLLNIQLPNLPKLHLLGICSLTYQNFPNKYFCTCTLNTHIIIHL